MLTVPIRTVSGMNAREHPQARAKRVKSERHAVGWALRQFRNERPPLPCVVTLTRIGPTNGLDPFDNLPSAFKGCVDALAEWLGVDDRKSDSVRYQCKQERGKEWAVRIEMEPAPNNNWTTP